MAPMKNVFFILALQLCFTSCGEKIDDKPLGGTQAEEKVEPQAEQFFTRLKNHLLIQGRKCFENELVGVADDQVLTCESDQWIVTVDNVNQCENESCTSEYIYPFIATMNFVNENSQGQLFSILNVSEIDQQTTNIIQAYQVLFPDDKEPVVLRTP